MLVTFISECEKKSLNRTRRVLDAFANRIGNNTWQTPITQEGLDAVKKLLQKTASKNTAVSCHQLKSRIRTKLLWVVGKREKFNNEGFVAVNYTNKNILKNYEENDWKFLPKIKALTIFAALLHDFGKASILFQNKLKGINEIKGDPLRHEWISVLFLVAIVDGKSDKDWLANLMEDDIHNFISNLEIKKLANPLDGLPPIASMLAWLILTHHKMPSLKNSKGKNISLKGLFKYINKEWGYNTANEEDSKNHIKECFTFTTLPSKSIEWQAEIKECAIKLHGNVIELEEYFNSDELRVILLYSRLSLMLADHYYSSLGKDKSKPWHSSLKLFANTDNDNKLKQQLDEHLVRVAEQAKKNIAKLPYFEGIFNTEIRVLNNKKLAEKSPKFFKWQDDAVIEIKKWRKNNKNIDKYQFGFFAVNIASTGKGKTFANAKIMQALSADEKSLRYILALGLRTLTLQTGDEYKNSIGLTSKELAVLIGSKAILDLHNEKEQQSMAEEIGNGSESSEKLSDGEFIFNGNFDEKGLDTILKNSKDRKFLYAPVLTCTIDYIIQATEITRGGKYILPTLRLMSSDLVIDEIDDFDNTDLIAIGRLIHLAGMLGRKVMISSATIPPDLAEGYFNAYQSGWNIFANMRDKHTGVGCAWIDEFKTTVKTVSNKEGYQVDHKKFIEKRIKNLDKESAKRKVNIQDCGANIGDYFSSIKDAIIEKHRHHNFTDNKTNKNISIGVVRMANVKPCVELTKYLLTCELSKENAEIKTMAYHSRQVLLMRHEQEKYLDKILKRKNGNQYILADETIRKHIDNSKTNNIIFVLVATPVEEVGRDHDFDWAVIEPSSYRSFIQLAGRVLRHREKTIASPNIAIMKYNLRALKENTNKGYAFCYPGYESDKYKLNFHNLEKLINVSELANKLDASNRIQRTKELNPKTSLVDLEHKVIADLLTNYSQKGPESMQGWLDSGWWLSGVPQSYVKFRGNNSQDMLVYLTIDNGFAEKSKIGNAVPISKDNIKRKDLSTKEVQNLWFKRGYENLLTKQAKKKDIEKTALIYGEINLPTYGKPLTNQQFIYYDQLGLVKSDD